MDISDADVSRIIKDGFERGAQQLGAASAADRRRLLGDMLKRAQRGSGQLIAPFDPQSCDSTSASGAGKFWDLEHM